ncbi:MAG: bifunctional diaminohydroxyphosphoribosylaminopyrimidine deaminase/5-amino-6-(5-phosphoribosylamino)uracil reductase RibD [Candidatus Aureabacteria bacterium]|nr:bifunctional diaminohydroxyphosphoribosylaminopyrimidine deaminase/5-amino-6-(5-phosphoribosylamino)uracil reductase RibD [Candidatus Auribacterota bacterium]
MSDERLPRPGSHRVCFEKDDIKFMRRALCLAQRGKGRTSPNPAVGAIIVRRGRVIGEGWHRRSGESHAEVRALARTGGAAHGATMYVTLEPCSTYGRTPPCTEAILSSGLSRVVVASLDPNPRHNGRGVRMLRRRGIRVDVGLLAGEASQLNEDFSKHIRSGIPFTTVKVAMSLDGKIATAQGDSRWISGRRSRRYAHRLRFLSDAIVVGRKTIETDDPFLTARFGDNTAKVPWRIVLDSRARIPLGSRILSPPWSSKTIIAVTDRAPRNKLARLEALGARIMRCPSRDGKVSIRSLWQRLGRTGITSILIEGGGETVASALTAGVVDKIVVFVAPKIIGGRTAPTAVGGDGVRSVARAMKVKRFSIARMGEDLLLEGYISSGARA